MLNRKSLSLILLAGFILRVIYAYYAIDVIHPDEHFQILEPAYSVVHGFGYLAWEWDVGLRSWFGPSLFIPVIKLASYFDINGGLDLVRWCKIFMALLFIPVGLQFNALLRQLKFSPHSIHLGNVLFALSATSLVWTTVTFSETESLFALWFVLPWILKVFHKNEATFKEMFLSGLFIVVPFWFRLQMLAWIGPFVILSFFFFHLSLKRFFHLALGSLSAVFIQGLLDYFTWGTFLHSTMTNIKFNLFKDVASTFGVDPWYGYGLKVFKDSLDPFFSYLLLFSVLIFIVLKMLKKTRTDHLDHPSLRVLWLSSLIFALVHSAIPHKEGRFLMSVFPILILTIVYCFEGISRSFKELQTSKIIPVGFSLLILCSTYLLINRKFDPYLPDSYASAIGPVYQHAKRNSLEGNVCTIGEHWSRGRGLLGYGFQGALVEIQDEPVLNLSNIHNNCDYLISKRNILGDFSQSPFPRPESIEDKFVGRYVYYLKKE